jgi:LCP family protein required for cell wall assembly
MSPMPSDQASDAKRTRETAMAADATEGGSDVGGTRLRWTGFGWRCLIALVIASVFMGSAVAMVDRGIDRGVAKIKRVHVQVAAPPPGGANYLIIGSDTREFVDNEDDRNSFGDPEEGGRRSDTLMVAHVEPSAQRTLVVSFPRDLMVDVPGTPGKSMINSAYSIGGPDLVIRTLDLNFGIPINHYLEVNFKTFQDIVDLIGKVEVFLPGRAVDELTSLSVPAGGCYALDGFNALAYVRARHIQVYDPSGTFFDENGARFYKLDEWSDLGRITRQQLFIRKLAGLAIAKSLSDPFLALSLVDKVIGRMTADDKLSRDDVNALVRAFRTLDVTDTTSVRFETIPVRAYPKDPNRVEPAPGADELMTQLRSFGDDVPRAATVAPSQVSVGVVDATGSDVGASVVETLKQQGFRASAALPEPKREVSEVRYAPAQTAPAKALLAYFPDAALVPDAKATSSVVLVLGASFPGVVTVPSTTTTAPPAAGTAAPGAPAATAPATTAPATTTAPKFVDPCPQ